MHSSYHAVPLVTPALILSVIVGPLFTLGPTQAAAAPVAVTRPESQQEYWARYEARDWPAAVEAARRLVAAAREKAAQQPLMLAAALNLLGNAQISSEDPGSAEATFHESLTLVEQHAGTTSPQLLDPLRGLGYTYALTERHDQAVPYLERALIIARRSYGLFDMQQQGLLRQLTASLTQEGRITDAERHIAYLSRVGERAYGKRDPRMAALLSVIGDWYTEVGNFALGREQYRNALDIMERKFGKNSVEVVQPLRELARSYTHEIFFYTQGYRPAPTMTTADGTESKGINPRYINSDGERALERALAILDSLPEPKPQLLAETLIQFGDWYQIKHLPERAMPYYKRAAGISLPATEASAKDAAAAAPLSFPVRVYYTLPSLAMRYRQLPAEQVDESFVEVQFTVTGTGDVADAKVTEENGSSRQVSETLQAVRAARYRPKFVNGQPVDTQNMTTREVFKTRKQADEDKESS
jgi:TonB family protein